VHPWLTHAFVEFCQVALCCFFMSAICVHCSVLYRRPKAEHRTAKFSTVPTHGLNCHSNRVDLLLRGQTERFRGWPDSLTPMGSDCHNIKMFSGRITTVSDGGGRSVTESKWVWTNHQSTQYLTKIQSLKKNMTGPRRKQFFKAQKLLECDQKPLYQYI
jgi:hypothetical protein